MKNYLVWDFDGTLACREGLWRGALLEVLRQGAPECAATADEIRPHLQTGFPWHEPHKAHPIRTAAQWWDDLAPVFERAYIAIGVEPILAHELARRVRDAYVAPKHWRLFEDTLPTLETLSSRGWTHLILSNHMPELGALVDHLGLRAHVERVFNSAETGYEKPHPLSFRAVLDYLEMMGGASEIWMIGDSYAADVMGAEAAGIPAILVRRHHAAAARFRADLTGVMDVVDS